MQGWLGWAVELEEVPYLYPGLDVQMLEDTEENWRRGCIPIGLQGDTYFTYLLVAGPDRGRIVYVEYEGSWVFFPREPDFISWYTRWLRDALHGVKDAFPYAMELLCHADRRDKEAMARVSRRNQERKAYKAAITALKDIFYETINPKDESIPRPYRLEMSGHALSDLGMYRTAPSDGIPLHLFLSEKRFPDGRMGNAVRICGHPMSMFLRNPIIMTCRTGR